MSAIDLALMIESFAFEAVLAGAVAISQRLIYCTLLGERS
jgi:hypothetical protein